MPHRWLLNILILSSAFLAAPAMAIEPPIDETLSKVEEVTSGLLSFKEWKGQKVSAAINEIVRLRRLATDREEVDTPLTTGGGVQKLKKLEVKPMSEELRTQLNQAKLNLDVVRDLSVTDYFVLYLTHQEDRKQAFLDAAKKLEASELAELLAAYDRQLRQGESQAASR